MTRQDEDRVINAQRATNSRGAAIDAQVRNLAALDGPHGHLFTDEHFAVVDQVRAIVEDFFEVSNGIYVNYRPNGGRPFTAVKVDCPRFPNHLSSAEKEARYRRPLRDLGVEPVFSKSTNSYLYRIYCDA